MWNITWPQPKKCEIPVADASLTTAERSNVLEALDSGWISSNGGWNHRAEGALTKLIGVESLLVSNGSVALTLALRALGVKHGDEVIVPSLTFAATASAVSNIGAVPVFCDVHESNWNMNEELLHSLLTKNTKAIIAVHLYGFPAPMNEIMNFARRYNLAVIEDCAEAPLASINGVNVGSFGDVATFSFFANKLISCGEGGAVASTIRRFWNT
jgi:perosamine synthetase